MQFSRKKNKQTKKNPLEFGSTQKKIKNKIITGRDILSARC